MVVYGHRTFRLNVHTFLCRLRERLDRLPRIPEHDVIANLLVDWAEAESAVADALLPDCDDEIEALRPWRAASDAFADVLCASWDDGRERVAAALDRVRQAAARLLDHPAPVDVPASTAEGFAYYGLTPEQYIAAADSFAAEYLPASVMCIGLRSIGSSLAHVVAAALRRRGVTADARSVRPRGHPFDRRLTVGSGMRRLLASCGATHFTIVDEGPGLSGSSFAAAADALVDIGVAPDRIVLFPSWLAPEPALRSPRAQAAWARHPKVIADFEDVWIESGRLFGSGRDLADISAGAWRRVVFADGEPWPAVHPQHERRKYLTRDSAPAIFRYVGLGARGESMRRRALTLAEAGVGTGAGRLRHGFLEQQWVSGRPLTTATRSSLDRMAAYVSFVRRAFATAEAERIDDVREVACANAAQLLGPESARAIDELARTARGFDEPRVAIDGRMLPHEWIESNGGLIKVDTLDHHDDDFWPGCRDIAWDVAGAIAELDLDRAEKDYFVAVYERESGDRTICRRLPFFEAAYLAYRGAYASLAGETLGDSADGIRFRRLRDGYRRSLEARFSSRGSRLQIQASPLKVEP